MRSAGIPACPSFVAVAQTSGPENLCGPEPRDCSLQVQSPAWILPGGPGSSWPEGWSLRCRVAATSFLFFLNSLYFYPKIKKEKSSSSFGVFLFFCFLNMEANIFSRGNHLLINLYFLTIICQNYVRNEKSFMIWFISHYEIFFTI